MPWQLGLSDVVGTNSANDLEEITGAKNRRPVFPLKGPDTVRFDVDPDNRLADRLLECKDWIFVYDDQGQQVLNAPVITAEEVIRGEEATIAVTAQAPWWWLGKRLVGKSHAGYTTPPNTDRSTMIRHLVENIASGRGDQNGPVTMPTYLGIGTVTPSGVFTGGPWHYKPIDDTINEIAATLDGPDWWLDYYGPGVADAAGNALTANMNIAPVRGTDRSTEVIFEYGTGQLNLSGYGRPVSREGLLSQAYGLPPGFPQTTEAVSTSLDATLESVYGAAEGVVPETLGDAGLRQELLREHVRVRKQPRQVITLDTIRHRAPRFKSAYDVGDIVTGRAVYKGRVRFDATFRVYMVTVEIDDVTGNGTPIVQVIPS